MSDNQRVNAIYRLAESFYWGDGVQEDLKRAAELYKQAAHEGHLDSIFSIGYCYFNGNGVEKDLKRAAELYKQAADKGHPYSIDSLGYCYENGEGVEKDLNRAAELFKQAADNRRLNEIYRLAGSFYWGDNGVEKDWKRAAELYKQAADQGHLDAICYLGYCYCRGNGVEKDLNRAAELYKQAADEGHLDSIYNLGVCYQLGIGVEKDLNRAVELYKQAADEGHLDSISRLGVCYYHGKGVKKDLNRVAELYKQAADKGDLDSIYNLGVCYANGEGVEKDLKRAAELYKQAADDGHSGSILNLGYCYQHGNGVEQDLNRAAELYKQAADKGQLDSIHNLGYCYENGIGVEEDLNRAAELYKQAADKGHLYSIYNLGVCYQLGIGVEKDLKRAAELYKEAADKGHVDSMVNLGFAMLYGSGMPQDYNKAIEMFTKAANERNVMALNNLAWMHRGGCGTPVDVDMAKSLLQLSIDHPSHEPQSLFLLADILAASNNPTDLRQARDMVNRVPRESELYQRSQWLFPFIEDQLCMFSMQNCKWRCDPTPDFIYDTDIQLVALIGEGQFGKVYLARFRRERWVAVKYMDVGLIQRDKDAVRNILRERFTCQIVHAHKLPSIVEYLGFVDDLGHEQRGLVFELCANISDVEHDAQGVIEKGFVATRFVDMETIPDWSKRVESSLRSTVVFTPGRRWSVPKIVGMLGQVAQALSCVHGLGVLHRDIADRNVLCDENGNIRLADFGLAKFVGHAGSHDGFDQINAYKKYLTPGHQYAIAWWAPECMHCGDGKGAVFSTNSDVYSFGVLLWQCFAHHDPFDDIKPTSVTDSKHIDESAEKIVARVLAGERPNVDQLDKDTPEDLVKLMWDCWETDPDKRPTLQEIIQTLKFIALEPASNEPCVIRSAKGLKEKWFDVAQMYRSLSLPEMRRRAELSNDFGSFTAHTLMEMLASVGHKVAPSEELDAQVVQRLGFKTAPYDVFLIHSGAQKKVELASMKENFEKGGLRCFIDADMTNRGGAPTFTMRSALESCRHAVAVVSRSFLERTDPCYELAYAFERMLWLRKQNFPWESLWVVFFDFGTSHYHKVRASTRPESLPDLPDACGETVLWEWLDGKGRCKTWPHLCHDIKAEIVKHDKECAVKHWRLFLEELDSHSETFPRAETLYKQHGEPVPLQEQDPKARSTPDPPSYRDGVPEH